MSTPIPLLADALGLLRADLVDHLSEADSLATQIDEWSDKDRDSARKVIGDLTLVIRGLLIEHERQGSGDCGTCSSVWPCPVVTSMHAVLKDPDREFVALVRRARNLD